MDEFLGRLGIQAVNYAMRCGIALTSTFAMQQCSRLLETVNNEPQYAELLSLQRVLDSKIKVRYCERKTVSRSFLTGPQIVSPALDLIEFKCVSSDCQILTTILYALLSIIELTPA